MSQFARDVRYASALLGLAPGASRQQLEDLQRNAHAYRYATRIRRSEVDRFVVYLLTREQFGTSDQGFDLIRRAYHRRAKELHPDTNREQPEAEELLKKLNTTFEIVDAMHREANAWFERDETERRAIEDEARRNAMMEARAQAPPPRPSAAPHHTGADARPAAGAPPRAENAEGAVYMACSVPRYIRNARLFYLGRDAVIGSRLRGDPGNTLVYDVIMLPEREFKRARLNLAIENSGTPDLSMSRMTPVYIPVDTKEVVIPKGEIDPHSYAQAYFIGAFNLNDRA